MSKEVINEGVDTWQHAKGSVCACLGGHQCPFLCCWVLSIHVKAKEFHELSAQPRGTAFNPPLLYLIRRTLGFITPCHHIKACREGVTQQSHLWVELMGRAMCLWEMYPDWHNYLGKMRAKLDATLFAVEVSSDPKIQQPAINRFYAFCPALA